MKLKTPGKIIFLLIVIGAAFGLYRMFGKAGGDLVDKFMPGKKIANSVVPERADLPSVSSSGPGSNANYPIPGDGPGCTDKPPVKILGYAWNAQMGMMFALGGPQATQGSLMCKHGVNLKFERQDDNGKLQEALTAFATALSHGESNPTAGAHFVVIMGDGSATFLKGLNDNLKKIGSEYKAKVVGSIGYSRGEDKLMGPAEWKTDPSRSKGGFVAGVLRDGDWNIAQKWLGDNGLKTNPDEKTYDPDALNWVNASDYTDAAQKYIAGYSEDRDVVQNGKKTGQRKHLVVQGVVTWTPGDVAVAKNKGGIVPIVSTKEYSSQMPAVVIGIDKWMKEHRDIVEGMLQAMAEGGDACKVSEPALHKAAEVSATCYHQQDANAEYWERYYKGSREGDANGISVDLGGSSANNLTDSLLCFGLVPGSANLFGATYTVFGNIVKKQYPDLLASFDPVDQVLDTSYLSDLMKKSGGASSTPAAIQRSIGTISSEKVKHVLSRKAWNIPFNTGSANFSPAAQSDLQRLRQDLLVASSAVVEIHGHTDNQGNSAANKSLSEARAFAVKNWLQKQFPLNFPDERVRVFSHGDENPVAPNSTSAGRAKNRRVEIVIGTTSG